LAHLSAKECEEDFHLGETVQLDDYPYVHMMRRISQALRGMGEPPVFFHSDDDTMAEPRDWGTLIHLLNEDYEDLQKVRRDEPKHAGEWLLDRFEKARSRVGIPAAFGVMPAEVRRKLVQAIQQEAQDLWHEKCAGIPDSLQDRTVVIEFARGGRDGSAMPLVPPYGYAYALSQLSAPILETASILYIWVTPEESRRKNTERTDPNDPGSILHHGVPLKVMLEDYGCDDMAHLLAQGEAAGHPGTVPAIRDGRTYHLPTARFDNRKDKTTFVRAEKATWAQADVGPLHEGMRTALTSLAAFPKPAR
jgi:hypothetical protein